MIDDTVDQWPTRLRACICDSDGHFEVPCDCQFVMAALCNRAGHYIFTLWFVKSFFPRLMSVVIDWMSTILLHMVWP